MTIRIKKVISNPYKIFVYLAKYYNFSWLSDKKYLTLYYRGMKGKKLDLNNPKTFNEKLQWLKLYDRNPLYTKMVDKYEVRDYISSIIGEEYLIPCLGVWDSIGDVDIEKLPEQFVLKCTHDSHSVVICKDKKAFDWDSKKEKLDKALKRNFYYEGRQWPYKDVKPRIIAEQYLSFDSGESEKKGCKNDDLADFKVWCFEGEPIYIQYVSGRSNGKPQEAFYSTKWEKQNFVYRNPPLDGEIERPERLEKLLSLSRKLSEGHHFLRTDFYILKNGQIKFGELTFYPVSGFGKFNPNSVDYELGNKICL